MNFMMNTMRKSISLLLTLLLTFSLVSVATAEGNPVLEGVYDLEKNDFGMETFYHFNADGTYYASFFMGAVTDAGTYEIKDEELAYMVSAGADGTAGTEDDEMATATQIVELVSYVNPTPVKVAYVDGKLVDISLAGMANHRTMALTEGKAYDASTETPIKVVNLYADNLEGNTLTLYHDKSFVDYTGEMGIGNTTASTAMACALLCCSPEDITGRGAGLSDAGLQRKKAAIQRALSIHRPNADDALDVLAKVGGFEIAGMVGIFLGGLRHHLPIVIDGVISAVAALTAVRIDPASKSAMLPSHMSHEPAVVRIMSELGMSPIIYADMALGEGTGAVSLIPLLDMALKVYHGPHTFDELGISAYEPQEGKA